MQVGLQLAVVVLTSTILGQAPAPSAEDKEFGGKKLRQWIAEIRHADPGVREAAIRAVVMFGPDARKAGKNLIVELRDADPSLRSNAAVAIGMIGLDAEDADDGIKALGKIVQSDSQAAVRVQAALTLAKFGPRSRPAVPAVAAAAKDSYASWEVRRAAVTTLGVIAGDPKEGPDHRAITALTQAARSDPCAQVKLHALTALILLGRGSATPPTAGDTQLSAQWEAQNAAWKTEKNALEALVKDADKLISLWARVALMRIDKVSETHLIQIGLLLKSTDLALRINAAQALGAMGQEARSQVPQLIAMLQDREPTAAAAAAVALVAFGEDATPALPALRELMTAQDPTLKAIAKDAVDRITKGDAKPKKPADK
jgi:HEAT repeat protein